MLRGNTLTASKPNRCLGSVLKALVSTPRFFSTVLVGLSWYDQKLFWKRFDISCSKSVSVVSSAKGYIHQGCQKERNQVRDVTNLRFC